MIGDRFILSRSEHIVIDTETEDIYYNKDELYVKMFNIIYNKLSCDEENNVLRDISIGQDIYKRLSEQDLNDIINYIKETQEYLNNTHNTHLNNKGEMLLNKLENIKARRKI